MRRILLSNSSRAYGAAVSGWGACDSSAGGLATTQASTGSSD